ncbi:MAG TPA: glycosyltransferase family 4 protein [Gaiellaceae bacterium]|nr:glycosyltransferase family 4 protein [Gaiellaceae bacterium]
MASDQRVKVLRVIARLNVGGPALHVAYLTAGLADRGYDTTLVAGTIARGEESMAFVADAHGVTVESLDALHREISPVRDARAILRLARLIRQERPTILHTHTAKAGAVGRIAALLAGDAKPPIIVHTFHGHVLRGYFGPLRTFAFRRLERWLARGTTTLVAVSPEVRDDLVALGVAPESKFTVVRLGIELENRVGRNGDERAETRRQLGLGDGDPFVVGWVGRMTAVKRTDEVVRVLRRLVDRGIDARLLLVGDGPDRDRLERYAHELGVVRRCLFLGYQEDVARWYDAMDALILPSVNEGTPVSVIESLAAERPAVATRVGGTPDVIREGVDGFLVEPGDGKALADRLEELANDPARRAQMGAAGRDRVLDRYAVDRLVDDIDKLYRELLSR